MTHDIPFFKTYINDESELKELRYAAKVLVRIPAGTYPGQLENARSFGSATKLLLRHHYFLWQIGPIFLYQTVSLVMLGSRANVFIQSRKIQE